MLIVFFQNFEFARHFINTHWCCVDGEHIIQIRPFDTLHTAFSYWCCHTDEEYNEIIDLLMDMEWHSFEAEYEQVLRACVPCMRAVTVCMPVFSVCMLKYCVHHYFHCLHVLCMLL